MTPHRPPTNSPTPRRRVLLEVADGPESIVLYTSEDEAVVDWGSDVPGLYLEASVNGASVRLGPFHCRSIRKYFEWLSEKSDV